MAENYHHESSDTLSLRQEVFRLLKKHPLLTAKPLCKLLDIDYKTYQSYINNLKTEWKAHYRSGLGSKRPKSQHNARAFCYTPKTKNCDRLQAVEIGWIQSRNRNKTLIWKQHLGLGRIEWFTSGKVIVYVKKPHTMGRVKQLLAYGFSFTGLISDNKILSKFMNRVKWKAAHDVFPTSNRLPYRVINDYVEDFGIRIRLGDLSHPNAVEVEWCHPDWLERLELMQQQNIKVIEADNQAFQRFNDLLNELSKPRQLPDRGIGVV